MSPINWTRVVLGGLLAGLVINLIQGVQGFLTMADWQVAMQSKGLPIAADPATMVFYLALGFLIGIVAVWLYAAVRPRLGPGPATAVKVAIAAWLLWYVPATSVYLSFGIFPTRLLAVTAIGGLVNLVVATLAGAWLYRES
jgi:hypothetical protein